MGPGLDGAAGSQSNSGSESEVGGEEGCGDGGGVVVVFLNSMLKASNCIELKSTHLIYIKHTCLIF